LGPILIQIYEASVAATTNIPRQGETWFKTTFTEDIEFSSYLKPNFQRIIWQKDVSRSYLEENWNHFLKEIQVYITCEDRYGRVMIYQFKLMNHFIGMFPLNLPHYLQRSLAKMSHQVQDNPAKLHNRLFHNGLIKIIVMEELQKREKIWDYLLFLGEFEKEI
jgi:hypothetical protein